MTILPTRQHACLGLTLLIAFTNLSPEVRAQQRAARSQHDWSRIHELRPGWQVVVRPLKGTGRKVAADYVSSSAYGLVVRTSDGQVVTFSKERIQQVTRKRRMRKAVVAGAAVGAAALVTMTLVTPDFSQPAAALLFGGAGAGLGALIGLAVRVLGRGSNVYKAPKAPRRKP